MPLRVDVLSIDIVVKSFSVIPGSKMGRPALKRNISPRTVIAENKSTIIPIMKAEAEVKRIFSQEYFDTILK